MANFWRKPWVNPFEKMLVFWLFEAVVFIAYTCVFSFKNMVKHIFLAYIAWKKKDEKMANFQPKPWVNPFGKKSVFRLFEAVVFVA